MSSTAIKVFGVIGFLIICALCLLMKVQKIEADLTRRSLQQLQDAGIVVENITVDGRDAILSGAVASEAAAQQAEAAVENVWGIRRVRNRLQVAPPAEPAISDTLEAAPAAATPPADTAVVAKPDTVPKVRTETQIRLDTLLAGKVIEFASGSHVLSPSSYPLLNQIAEVLKQKPDAMVEIAGHTDASGGRQLNLTLSRQRAEAIRAYLLRQGIDGKRLKAAGYGPDRPIASNNTPQGKQKNRRVEFNVLEEN
ncbi:MAG: OmpA family protein [Calditrichaeota bacterium]|nr:OmpA family protein [Calditrichota bacterium]